MSVTAKCFGNFIKAAFNKEIDLDTNDIKVALFTSATPVDQDAMVYFDDITGEAGGTGYDAGGKALENKTVTYTDNTNVFKFDADNVTWTTSSVTARYAILYCATGTAGTSALISYVDFGEDKTSATGNFTITWDNAGIFTCTIA